MTQEEFKSLFKMHFAEVRAYVFYRSGDTEIATDIAQETFLRIWEKQEKIKTGKVKGLLFKIANDLFISDYRKSQRSFNFFNQYQAESESRTPEDELAFEQLKQSYNHALNRMPEKHRTVFLMSRVENLKYAEIAEMVGISVKAVEKRMKAALDFLRSNLNRDE